MKLYFLLAPAVLGLSSAAFADVMSPPEYVATAGASDLFERTASQIVLETTADPKIREFATMMVQDHGKSTAMVKAAAARSHVPPAPPQLMQLQAEMIAELRAETGPARDATYLAQQKAAHGQALTVQQAYAMDGAAPALRDAAGKIVPVVQHHIAMLAMM